MKIFVRAFWVFFCLTFQVNAYQLTTQTDATQVAPGEALTLTIIADDMVSESPDLSALRTDFRVLSTSVSRQTSYNNGQKSAQTTWKIGLIPLKTGKLQIPAVNVGTQATSPLPVEVSSAAAKSEPSGALQETNAFTIEGKIVDANDKIYVQQEILYDIIISDNGTLQSGEPVFQTNDSSEWIIKNLGRPEIAVSGQGGRRMITYHFALFPQKSGRLHIPAVIFDGQAFNDELNPSFDPFGNGIFNVSINLPTIFGMNAPVRLSVPAKEIDVLPVPEGFKGSWWLPAEDVKINARWLGSTPNFQVGEAVTREIVLTATGAAETQLPELKFDMSTDMKQYPQKSEKTETVSAGKLTATQKINVVYIPQKSGNVTLSEIRVPWFNVKTNRIEMAVVPAMTITVKPNADEMIVPKQPVQKAESKLPTISTPELKPEVQKVSVVEKIPAWLWAIAAFGLGVLFAAFLLKPKARNESKPMCETRRFPDYIVQKAYQGDFRALRDALVTWATGFYPEKSINNLKDIAQASGDEAFSRQMDILMEKLYQADSQQVWNAKIFADSFKRLLGKKEKKAQKNPTLPKLYD